MMYKLTLVASFTGNPVFTVSTKDASALNEKPTIDTLIEDVKVLNGVGEIDNSVLSEQWSSRVASALFEHEQMIEISSMSEFDLTNYPESTMKLASQFKAVAGYMKSRAFHKVNREAFVVSQNGFDMHKADTLAISFQEGEPHNFHLSRDNGPCLCMFSSPLCTLLFLHIMMINSERVNGRVHYLAEG